MRLNSPILCSDPTLLGIRGWLRTGSNLHSAAPAK